jgi:phage terminase small subunit
VGAPKGLTQKQARFCAEYAIDSNATRAAMAAGYSKSSARVIGSQLLQIPAVKAEVRRLELEILGRLELTADSVKEQIRRIGFFDIATIY